VARALAVEIDVVPGGPAACGALIGVNFWACGFFAGGVVSFTYSGLMSAGVPLGVGAGMSSGMRVDGAALTSSIAVGDAALSSSIAAGDVAVSSRVGVSNSLALGAATIGSAVASKVS
jgi:hypothetical protein